MSDFHDHDSLTAHSLERIADTLDDYMLMSLSLNAITAALRGDPEYAAVLKPLTDVIEQIKQDRATRSYS